MDSTDMMKKEKNNGLSDQYSLSQIGEHLPDIVYIMELATKKVLYCNRRISEYLGYSQEYVQALENPVLDIIYEEDKPAVFSHIAQMMSAKDGEVREIEYRMKNSKGDLCWFRDRDCVFSRDKEGQPLQKIAIAHEIT